MSKLSRMSGLVAVSLLICARATADESPRAPSPTRAAASDAEDPSAQVVGIYRSVADSGEVWIGSLGKGALQVAAGAARHGVGFWDGTHFRGVWRPSLEFSRSPGAEAYGEIRFEVVAPETIRAQIWSGSSAKPSLDVWVRSRAVVGDRTVLPPDNPADPRPGDYVYVEELPEALTKVAPSYPGEARRQGVDGTVMVQALVGKDGRVKETIILKSIPALDAAAAASVMQWIFRPARAKGAPVAVWVAVPIKFSLH